MRDMNEYLPTAPFDIYELHLFHLVAQHRSFTKAAEVAGLTQSAVTRQVQGMEASLGLELFERTTRSVQLTAAGTALWRETVRLLAATFDQTLKTLREEFAGRKKEIRVGVSRSVGLASLRLLSRQPSTAAAGRVSRFLPTEHRNPFGARGE